MMTMSPDTVGPRRRHRCSALVLALALACAAAVPSGARAIAQADACEESLADIGRSYNVSGWTISRLTA